MTSRIYTGLFLAGLLCLSVQAQQSLPLTGAGGAFRVSGFIASCTQSSNFLARTSGLDTTHKTNYDNLICGLETDGIGCSNTLDALYALMTDTTTNALLNLCSSSFALTVSGSPTFTANVGYTGDGSAAFLNTHWTTGGFYAQNDASVSVCDLTSGTTSGADVIVGAQDTGAGTFSDLIPMLGGTSVLARTNTPGASSITVANATRAGFYTMVAAAGPTQALYKAGSSIGTASNATTSIASLPSFYILARDDSASASSFTADQIAIVAIGKSLNSTGAGNLRSRVNTYATAYGKSC